MRAVLIRPEATAGEMVDVDGSLESLQALVGGHIEHVQLVRTERGGVGMYAHDEGMIIGLPVNRLATALYWRTRRGGVPDELPYAIHGPVVVLAGPDFEGDDEPIGVAELDMLEALGVEVEGEL